MRNATLASLPSEELDRLLPRLQPVTLVAAQVLYEVGELIEHVYFVETGLISLMADTGDNSQVDVGITGREGLVGVQVLLGAEVIAVQRTLVQLPASALRISAAAFRDAADNLPVLRDRCLRQIQVLLAQASQIAGCNVRHELPERLARWLLSVRDRVDSDELTITQEFLANMLGVRRSGVSVVANSLQSMGLIRQGRGRVIVLDRAGLEVEACDCYRLIEDARRRIMGNSP